MEMPQIGERVKRLRMKKDYSQDYVASKLGMSQRAYSKIENNETKLSIEHLYKLGEVFEMPVSDILDPENRPVYNNFNTHNGEGIVINKYTSDKITELYERLIASKDAEIETLKSKLRGK